MADNAVMAEGGARYVCAPGAPGKRRRCLFVKDGHRSNRGYVVLRAVGGGAPPGNSPLSRPVGFGDDLIDDLSEEEL